MKYKIGDRVRITEELIFTSNAEDLIAFLDSNRISTIRSIKSGNRYFLNGLKFYEWEEEWLEEVPIPIENRWEILDI